nr:reverse transcriptase N-terminal domain-containing protein [Synechococcus sp. PCC 7336]
MLRSYSNLLLSVRRIAQENRGRKTAGLDGKTAQTPAQRVKLCRNIVCGKCNPLNASISLKPTKNSDRWGFPV